MEWGADTLSKTQNAISKYVITLGSQGLQIEKYS